ncbi:MAG: hypothetical protein P4K83_06900 [Terracidiphilus sp.]|nr:hypothetical protein [Terracidiphilus sp.]
MKRFQVTFLVCSVITALYSLCTFLMEGLIFLGIGWDYALYNLLLFVTFLSTVGLIAGSVALKQQLWWAPAMLLCSSFYVPVAFVGLTMHGFTPPHLWWPLLPLSIAEIVLCAIGLRVLDSKS